MPTVRTPEQPPRSASIAAWEGEGGATAPWPAAPQPGADDGPLIALLGAAVVARWNDLPTAAQRAIFETAADRSEASGRLARFLHARHDDAR